MEALRENMRTKDSDKAHPLLEQLEQAESSFRAISEFADLMYELMSKAEILRQIGERIAHTTSADEIREIKQKIPIFLRLDLSLRTPISLDAKVSKMLVLAEDVERLQE